MPDGARSESPAVQRQLDRLWSLSSGADVLGLERITALLARVGDPHRSLPPVLHVAGTNGKGSTCAFLRAAVEAAGLTAHVYTSPHLVRFNERIRIAGRLIDDETLAALLGEVLDHADGIGASFFEVTTAAAFLAFSRTPASCSIIEVGLGGRLDATNVVSDPIVTGIAQLGLDHQSFLGDTIEEIAAEKAGIAKRGIPLVTMRYPAAATDAVARAASAAQAPLVALDSGWRVRLSDSHLFYADGHGEVQTPPPGLAGPHQPDNLGLAIAMLRHQTVLDIPVSAFTAAARWTEWPARLQRLNQGPLTALLPKGTQLWLDGCHNPAAAQAISPALRKLAGGRPVHLVLGMLANKDAAGLLSAFAGLASTVHAVPVPEHDHHEPDDLKTLASAIGIPGHAAPDVEAALRRIGQLPPDPHGPAIVLILGSLYLAGNVLAANGQLPV